MAYKLGRTSKRRLIGVHPDLVAVVERAIQFTEIDFTVGEGIRSIERQRALKAAGDSWTLKSRHITGHAVDLWALVGGQVSWNEKQYIPIGQAMKDAAEYHGVKMTWGALKKYGGDWRTVNDMPHFELNRRAYQLDIYWEDNPRNKQVT